MGRKALEKLEGMWAFAWYNEVSGNLLLSRDRFGEKPLYFGIKIMVGIFHLKLKVFLHSQINLLQLMKTIY